MFEELFVQAEERFDLAACETLLASLDEHLPRLDDDLLRIRDDSRLRLARRLQWSDDWHRTRRFLEREDLVQALDALLADRGPRTMQLHAAVAWARPCTCAGSSPGAACRAASPAPASTSTRSSPPSRS